METLDKNNSKLSTKQKQDCYSLMNLALEYTTKINKKNALKAVKCFEAIPPGHFPDLYMPLASSVYINLGWFLIVDKYYKQAEIYLKRVLELGSYLVPLRLGHIKYLQNNLKEAVDFYMKSSQKLGFLEEIIIGIQDDFTDLKVSEQNIKNFTNFLTDFNRDKTLGFDSFTKKPDKSTPELTSEYGYWKYSTDKSMLLFSSADIEFSFHDGQKVIENFDIIKNIYSSNRDKIEILVKQIMIYENKKVLHKIITESNVEEKEWVWNNWSLFNVVEEQDFEKRFGYEDKVAKIKLDVNKYDLEVSF